MSRDFHACLAEPLRETWPVLFGLVESLRNRTIMPVASALRADSALMAQYNCDHRDLVTAIRDGDSKGAARITSEHLARTLNVFLKSLAAEGSSLKADERPRGRPRRKLR